MAEGQTMQDVPMVVASMWPASLPQPMAPSLFAPTFSDPLPQSQNSNSSSISTASDTVIGSPRSSNSRSLSLSSTVTSSSMEALPSPTWPPSSSPPTATTFTAAAAQYSTSAVTNSCLPPMSWLNTPDSTSVYLQDQTDLIMSMSANGVLGTDAFLLNNALQAAAAANAAGATTEGLAMFSLGPLQPQVMALQPMNFAAPTADGRQLFSGAAVTSLASGAAAGAFASSVGLGMPTLAPLGISTPAPASATGSAFSAAEPTSPTAVPAARVKVLLHSGGKFHKDKESGRCMYIGGETRLVTVRPGLPYADLLQDLDRGTTSSMDQAWQVKFELPDSPDMLVDIINDDDVQNMWEEWQAYAMVTKPANKLHVYIQLLSATK